MPSSGLSHGLWRDDSLHNAAKQMATLDLHCPFSWMSEDICLSIQDGVLEDCHLFCPSLWDSIVYHLVFITKSVMLGDAEYSKLCERMNRCYDLMANRDESSCPLIQEYHSSILHVLDATWGVITCTLLRADVTVVFNINQIPKLEDMTPQAQSGVWAIRSAVMRACNCSVLPTDKEAKKSSLLDHIRSAAEAHLLHPDEGAWRTLLGSAILKSDARKKILLETGFEARRSPYTCIEYAANLAQSVRSSESTTLAALLCEMALRDWPDSLFVNLSYLLMFLRTACRRKLAGKVARRCMTYLLDEAPQSPVLMQLMEELKRCRKFELEGRPRLISLPPISEENEGDSGVWCSTSNSSRGSEHCDTSFEEDIPTAKPQNVLNDNSFEQEQLKTEHAAESWWDRLPRDAVNCVCTSVCAALTYKQFGTLHPLQAERKCSLWRATSVKCNE